MLIEIFKIWVGARKRYFTDILEYMLNPETETVEVPTKEVFMMAKIARKKYFYDTTLNYLYRKTNDGREEVSKEYIDKALTNVIGGFGDMLSGGVNIDSSIVDEDYIEEVPKKI